MNLAKTGHHPALLNGSTTTQTPNHSIKFHRHIELRTPLTNFMPLTINRNTKHTNFVDQLTTNQHHESPTFEQLPTPNSELDSNHQQQQLRIQPPIYSITLI
ncbi:hypothetical protein Drorol1_Dr00008137 [Drosera rotundifolia]